MSATGRSEHFTAADCAMLLSHKVANASDQSRFSKSVDVEDVRERPDLATVLAISFFNPTAVLAAKKVANID